LIRLELFGPGVQYIADNPLYNSITAAHAIIMILFVITMLYKTYFLYKLYNISGVLFYLHILTTICMGIFGNIDIVNDSFTYINYCNTQSNDLHTKHPGIPHVFENSITIGQDELINHPERIPTCDFNKSTPLTENDETRHIAAHLSSRTYYTCSISPCHVVKCANC
jgi:hypothetical protein